MEFIRNYLISYELSDTWVRYLSIAIMIAFIIIVCILANFIAKKIVIRFIIKIIHKNKFTWDNILLESKIFHRLSHLVPAIIIFYSAAIFPTYQSTIEKFAIPYMIIVALGLLNSLLTAFHDIYKTYEISKIRPIKSYIQVAKIANYIIGTILVIANLLGENPIILLSGIGALSAVFMLVFRDSLLGLVAGIQLTANDMVRVGDWIEMPKYGANGDVIDISLNTVKVRNFDRTITSVPSYALISDSFINWRGMQASGNRRIKRSLFIDITSISFCSEELLEKCKKIHLLKDYIVHRQKEIEEYNQKHQIDRLANSVNGRALTNIGLFRAYITQYLIHHPGINEEATLMVRQLAPTENGLPLEIYAFANTVVWTEYESIQSDIFDHLFAVAQEFGLRLFQMPTGSDLKNIPHILDNAQTNKRNVEFVAKK